MADRPLLILGDAHLGQSAGGAVARDLARLVLRHPGREIVLAGDTLDLSWLGPPSDPLSAIRSVMAPHPELCTACRDHLAAGVPLTLLAGNHDVALGLPGARRAVAAAIGLEDAAPLAVEGWFVRRGDVHVEHGHVYDPDNAPAHPLVPWSEESEPLGVALTRRLVAGGQLWDFAHAHDTTFVSGLWRAFRSYGPRGLRVVGEYYRVALRLWMDAGPSIRLSRERAVGASAIAATAARLGLQTAQLEALVEAAARPRHQQRLATFQRLYLDRSLAILAILVGAMAYGPAQTLARGLVLGGTGYLGGSVLRRTSRYRGRMEDGLRDAARAIRAVTGACLVVFGHTHQADAGLGYVNLGSFGHAAPGARPYLLVDLRGGYQRGFI